jgi:hypothetical protein
VRRDGGEVRLTRLLLGLGLRNFSMHPAHLLTVARVLTTEVGATKLLVDRISGRQSREDFGAGRQINLAKSRKSQLSVARPSVVPPSRRLGVA